MLNKADVILSRLNAAGFKGYCVGGCVRDMLMGIQPGDIDITTDALPQQVTELFSGYRVIPTGIAHGTVTVIANNTPFEITTFRCDGGYSDHRHPDGVTFTGSLRQDCARRDFTVNAIAYNPQEGIIDYFDGCGDIKKRVLRCVGEPEERFSEDALRIMRAVRFCSTLGFTADDKTSAAMNKLAPLLDNISPERLLTELKKLLNGTAVTENLIKYSDIICAVIPEMKACVGFDQHSGHHAYDVYTHSAYVVGAVKKQDCLPLAALLHDAAKPECFFINQKGGHFPGHADRGAELARVVLQRLKADRHTVETTALLIKNHYGPLPKDDIAIKKQLKLLWSDYIDVLNLKEADNSSKLPGQTDTVTPAVRKRAEWLMENSCCRLRELAVDGKDAVEAGLSGAAVGKALNGILDMVIEEKLPNERTALIEQLKKRSEI